MTATEPKLTETHIFMDFNPFPATKEATDAYIATRPVKEQARYKDGKWEILPTEARGMLNRDYKKWMQAQTDALLTAVGQYAREQTGKAITPLSTWRYDKEQLARKRQEQTGLIGVWSCQESCWSCRAHYCAENALVGGDIEDIGGNGMMLGWRGKEKLAPYPPHYRETLISAAWAELDFQPAMRS